MTMDPNISNNTKVILPKKATPKFKTSFQESRFECRFSN